MTLKEQIELGLKGDRSVTNSLIFRYARQQKIDPEPILKQFQESVKSGGHAEMYMGSPADWTFIPRTARFGFGA